MRERAIADLVRGFYEDLWNRWDDAAVDGLLAEDFEFRGSLGTTTCGREGWRSYRDSMREGAADFHNEIVTLICDGDQAAARLRWTGTHSGTLNGWPATGRRFSYDGAAVFTAAGGRLTSAWVVGDLIALQTQVGPAHQ